MRRSMLTSSIAAAAVTLAAMSLSARAPAKPGPATSAKSYVTPKTPWGDPDLRGVYTNNDESGIPFERPAEFDGKTLQDVSEAELNDLRAERAEQALERAPTLGGAPGIHNPVHWFENFNAQNSRAWLVIDPPDGHTPPLTPEGQRRAAAAAARPNVYNTGSDSYEERGLYDRCITRGIPGSMMPAIYGNAYEIVQGPGWVGIEYEMIHEARVIPLDGRPHASGHIRMLMGDPRGHWEGHTLVVETTNFDERSAYRGATSSLTLIERFTRVAPDVVGWSVTVDDPHTWTRPWTFAMNLTKTSDSQRPFEYACHEGNYGLRNILSAARAEEEKAAKSGRQVITPAPAAPRGSALVDPSAPADGR
jgi:hypothetical protein